jgi:hypothetical protein
MLDYLTGPFPWQKEIFPQLSSSAGLRIAGPDSNQESAMGDLSDVRRPQKSSTAWRAMGFRRSAKIWGFLKMEKTVLKGLVLLRFI